MQRALTEKQKKFIDYYIETGNQTEAARLAGYKKPLVQGNQNYEKLRILIQEKLDQKASERIAKQDEVLQYLTSVMRGDEVEEVVVVEGQGEGYSSATTIDKKISAKDRIKASELLGKRYGLFTDKVKVDGVIPIVIVDDMVDEGDEES